MVGGYPRLNAYATDGSETQDPKTALPQCTPRIGGLGSLDLSYICSKHHSALGLYDASEHQSLGCVVRTATKV